MSRLFKQVLSILLAAALLLPAAWIAPVAKAEVSSGSAQTVTVFHETFAGGKGAATQAGGATLTAVTGKVFTGNDDGNAVYVSNRKDNWDSADFKFADLGMQNGQTYTVTVSVYVDADVTVPAGAQAALQTVDSYGWLAGADYTAGSAVTLTKEFTVDTSKDSAIRVQSNEAGKAVPYYIGDLLITKQQAVPVTTTEVVYHETFAGGKGTATQAGGANLTALTGKVFAGNDDGNAVYVSNRKDNWDSADFKFADLGMQNGQTYTVKVSVYVDADVTVPTGAQAALQTVDSYGWLAGANYTAGSAVTLTKEFTVDTSKDSAIRVQSNEEGKAVPYYIGDVLITRQVENTGGETETPRDPALPFTQIGFEDQTAGGFVPRGGDEILTVTDEANHTEGGRYALKVEGRTQSWNGPSLRVERYVDKGYEYRITAWVKLISPASSQLQLSTQVGEGSSASYVTLSPKTISATDGWVQLEGTYRYNNVSSEYLTIYVESSNNATASYYIDDINFQSTGSGPVSIEDNLTPVKDVYKDDFLIGNAISAEDLEGVRLKLLKKHFNVATAGNAMKPDALQPTKGNFTFTAADAMVDKVRAEGMQMHAHVLVWHQQSPAWLNTASDGQPLGRAEALENLRTHIKTVMEHFGDRVISWDVVNEAMNDNPSNPSDYKASLRKAPWYNAIGPDYVEQAFLAAREVLDQHPTWNIKLYYNDYNEDNQSKATAIYNMVKDINDRYASTHDGKRLIDGIGMQAHYSINTNPDNVKLSMEKFISLGVSISVSELDVQAGSNYTLTEKQSIAQGYLYAQLFELYKAHADKIDRVTVWGLDDNTSWRADENPLLFDKDLKGKPAYYGVIDPAKFMSEHTRDTVDAIQSTAAYATPTVDGTIDTVWSNAPVLNVNRYQNAWQGATGVAKALWDDHNLYVLVQVSDTQLNKTNANAWEQDSVEVFVDENNGKTSFYQDDDGQYRVNFENTASFNPASIEQGFESAVKVSGTNYTVEMKIPFKKVTPAKDKKIGFDVQINDAKDGSRQSVAAWNDTSGKGYMDTSVYGVLTLGGKSSGTTGGGGGSPADQTTVESKDGIVTVKPEVKTEEGRAKGVVSNDHLKKALEQAAPGANGTKQLIIDLPAQKDAQSYELQLPAQSLKGQEAFELVLKTGNATLQIPSGMLSNVKDSAEQVSIRVDQVPVDKLDAATRERVGSHPVLDLSVVANGSVLAWNNPDAPVKVAIPYTLTEEERNHPDHIVIWYIDDKGKVTPIPNGRYDADTGTVVFQTTHFSTYAVVSVSKTFGDLNQVPWAQTAIEAMAARDVIQGTAEASFSPDESITRADFIALLVRALELKGSGKATAMFGDVQQSDYYYNELAIARELGIAEGYEDNNFKPLGSISRQDMMVLTTRALAAAGKRVEGSGTLGAFADAASVAGYAKDSASALVKAGIVNGKDEHTIAPNDPLTRAEAAVVLYRVWNL